MCVHSSGEHRKTWLKWCKNSGNHRYPLPIAKANQCAPTQKRVPYFSKTSNFMGGWDVCLHVCAYGSLDALAVIFSSLGENNSICAKRQEQSVPFLQKSVWCDASQTTQLSSLPGTSPRALPSLLSQHALSNACRLPWLNAKTIMARVWRKDFSIGSLGKWQIKSAWQLPLCHFPYSKHSPPHPTHTQSKQWAQSLA